ncbi:MAG: tRNA epoxyqueuosine(34) reductase QueG [Phycisphaeraceae bacterium]
MGDTRLTPSAPRAQTVARLAKAQGFTLVGIAPVRPSEHAEHLRQWVAAGKHGTMDYLAQHVEDMIDPTRVLPGAKAIICVAEAYADPSPPGRGWPSPRGRVRGSADERGVDQHDNPSACNEQTPFASDDPLTPTLSPGEREPDQPIGRIARYAWGDDYHVVMKKHLHALADELRALWPEHAFRSAVDTAPVLERQHAQHAGLGWAGKHTLLIHPTLGSWFMLGEILTTLPLQTAEESPAGGGAGGGGGIVADHCGTCTRCIDACPTQCITPYSIDASRCVSYLTIEHRGRIDPSLHEGMGDWLAGCDVCQSVCPFNHPEQRQAAPIRPPYHPRPPAPGIPVLDVLNWTPESRQQAVLKSALKRLKLEQFKRNALIAAGNHLRQHDDPPLRRRITELCDQPAESDLVRQTARDVLARLARLAGLAR